VFGKALEFAGDYVEVPFAESLAVGDNAFTVALWFRTSERRLQRIVHAYNYGDFPQWSIEIAPGSSPGNDIVRGLVQTDISLGRVTAQGNIANGGWHHVVLVRDDAGVTLSVDGKSVAGAPVPGSVSGGALCGIRIGVRTDGLNNPLVGAVDEVYLFDQALTAAQISDLATTNSGPEGDPLLHLRLDEVL
jgi:sialidase-1